MTIILNAKGMCDSAIIDTPYLLYHILLAYGAVLCVNQLTLS